MVGKMIVSQLYICRAYINAGSNKVYTFERIITSMIKNADFRYKA